MKIARLVYDTQIPKIDVELEVLQDRGQLEIVAVPLGIDDDALIKKLEGYDALLTDYVPLTKNIITQLKDCKVISLASTGFTSVDIEAAKEQGIMVCAIGEYCTQEVAEHTMTLLLALQRRLPVFMKSVQEKHEWDWLAAPDIDRLEGQTLGVLGLGRIGQAVAKRAQVFGMKILAYDPYLPPHVAEEQDVKLVDLDELFAESDFITVHMAVDEKNTGFLDEEKFKKMNKKPFLINVARGTAVNQGDLVKALDEGLIKGAALDVLDTESPDLANHPLVGRDNVILTPHVAFYSRMSMYLNNKISMENTIYALTGEYDKINKIIVSA